MEPFPVFFLKEETTLDGISMIEKNEIKKDNRKHEQNKNIEYLQELTKSLPSILKIKQNAENEHTLRE